MLNWKNVSPGDQKRYQIIASMLEQYPKLLKYLFHPSKPELVAPAEDMLQNALSGGEKVLVKAAIDLWNGNGGLKLMELKRLDDDNEMRVLKAYIATRYL